MRKFFSIILIFFFMSVAYADNMFIDVDPSDWFYGNVMELTGEGIISGYEDQTFRPGSTISVEEFVTLTVKALGESPVDMDVKRWSDGFIARAEALNLVQMMEFSDVTREITRGEMARIALRARELELPDDYLKYASMIKDFHKMDAYWQNIAVRSYALGIIAGYPDGTYRIEGTATRAEAAAIIGKIYEPGRLVTPEYKATAFDIRRNEILNAWKMLQPKYSGSAFEKDPVTESPYYVGKLDPLYLNDAINMLNFLRALADLQPVYESPTANAIAQHGALLLATSEFSHTPSKPADMETTMYDIGYNATSTGNLAAGIKPLSTAIIRLVDDEDIYNIEKIGHRRWFLLPSLYEVGMGYVEVDDIYRYYSAIKVFDGLATQAANYEYVLWPGETAFPLEFMDISIPWSLSLNPKLYDNDRVDEITVKLSNLTTGTNYSFDKTDKDLSGEYFNVETTGYGIPFCIIFRPDYVTADPYGVNDIFEVTISNVYTISGDRVTLKYTTQFFSLQD